MKPVEDHLLQLTGALYSIVIAFWVGSQIAIGYIAAPVLFSQLADRTLAGNLAGAMFSVMARVGLGCGAYLLLYLVMVRGAGALRFTAFWLVVLMVTLTLAGHSGIQPILVQLKAEALPQPVMESVLRDRFALWHGVSSVLYLFQTLAGIMLVLMQGRGEKP